ncbi:MAG: hypothetical protein KatS3mg108_0289 [Isosphaeraceae bacterium]|nr:MAG: hypothetical protein KatS3mg108_0289 [Isosphaeraceae bacterium]
MTPRTLLSWKGWFYDLALPQLAKLPPHHADRALTTLGLTLPTLYWPQRQLLHHAVLRASAALQLNHHDRLALHRQLAAHTPRFLARDLLLNGLDHHAALNRFVLSGQHHLHDALAAGRGAILLGAHFGAYLPALHALFRLTPLRALLQLPQHASNFLRSQLTNTSPPHPQNLLLLKRNLPPPHAAHTLLHARAALRDGFPLATFGDITHPNGQPTPWLGQTLRLQTAWINLALCCCSPVIPLFATHLPAGRFLIHFEPPLHLSPQSPHSALTEFLNHLERHVRSHPHEAIPYWTWPAYQPLPSSPPKAAA